MTLRTKIVGASSRLLNYSMRAGITAAIQPVVTVNEYPKSGGTWLAKMLAVAIDIPFIDNSLLPPGGPCVIRTHWDPYKSTKPCVFVVRDCRDVMVSYFYHRLKNIDNTPRLKQMYEAKFPAGLQASQIKVQLPIFIQLEFSCVGYGSYLDWRSHVLRAVELAGKDERYCLVKYEDVLEDPVKELDRVIQKLTGKVTTVEKLELVVKAFELDLVQKNQLLNSAETTFVRQGGAGGWKQHFNDESDRAIAELAGDALQALGYN